MEINLLSFSKGSGCGCKINPAVLRELLSGMTTPDNFDRLIVGNSLSDDCSVYDLGSGKYLLQTVDFFTPIVNDAYTFGAAASANALSDIWAMGGTALMANAVFSWPLDQLSIDLGRDVLRGASDICRQAGIPLAGGHSIDGKEPLFGLSVTGICSKDSLKRNKGAADGDLIYLSRPLGTGMLAAAHKRQIATEMQNRALYDAITQLNIIGEKLGNEVGIHAMTDVTGFGLAGHLLEICHASEMGAVIQSHRLPRIPEAEELAAGYILPDNAMRNWNNYESEIDLKMQSAFPWLVDPQTNGGLLIAADPKTDMQKLGEFFLIGKFDRNVKGLIVTDQG